MKSIERRLSKLEASQPVQCEGVLWLREGEKIKDGLSRYESEGRAITGGFLIGEEAGEGVTPDEWAAKCLARKDQPFTWYQELKELGLT